MHFVCFFPAGLRRTTLVPSEGRISRKTVLLLSLSLPLPLTHFLPPSLPLFLHPSLPPSHPGSVPFVLPGNSSDPLVSAMTAQKMALAAAMCLAVGLVQLMMGVLRLGFLTRYLSDPMISGFTTGASVHVFTSQVKYALGVDIPRHSGAFTIPKVRPSFLLCWRTQVPFRYKPQSMSFCRRITRSSSAYTRPTCQPCVYPSLLSSFSSSSRNSSTLVSASASRLQYLSNCSS